jgi:hypothetical protein
MQGNPDEFPSEIKKISGDFACELTLLPWRPSVYLQKFFWQLDSTIFQPIVLVVQTKTEVQVEPEGKAGGSGGSHAVHVPPAAVHPTGKPRRPSMKYNTARHFSIQHGIVDVSNRPVNANNEQMYTISQLVLLMLQQRSTTLLFQSLKEDVPFTVS